MNTKEAIRNVEDTYNCYCNNMICDKKDIERMEKEKNEIVELLKRGKNFEAIVNELEKECGYFYYGSSDNLYHIIPKLKQKYFQKEKGEDNVPEK